MGQRDVVEPPGQVVEVRSHQEHAHDLPLVFDRSGGVKDPPPLCLDQIGVLVASLVHFPVQYLLHYFPFAVPGVRSESIVSRPAVGLVVHRQERAPLTVQHLQAIEALIDDQWAGQQACRVSISLCYCLGEAFCIGNEAPGGQLFLFDVHDRISGCFPGVEQGSLEAFTQCARQEIGHQIGGGKGDHQRQENVRQREFDAQLGEYTSQPRTLPRCAGVLIVCDDCACFFHCLCLHSIAGSLFRLPLQLV